MDTPTFEELFVIQKHIKDAMDANTLVTVKGDGDDLDVVEQPIDDDLQKKLREAWKHVYLVMNEHHPGRLSHKVNRV